MKHYLREHRCRGVMVKVLTRSQVSGKGAHQEHAMGECRSSVQLSHLAHVWPVREPVPNDCLLGEALGAYFGKGGTIHTLRPRAAGTEGAALPRADSMRHALIWGLVSLR